SKDDLPVTYILDEFVRLGKIRSIIEMPAIGRGYKVNSLFVIQDYEQISKTYSQQDLGIIESNTAYKIILQQNNFMTAERISKLIGNQTVKRKSTSRNTSFKSHGKNISISEEGLPLVRPEMILNLEEGEAILLTQGYVNRPIKCNIPYYFKQPVFKNQIARAT
ncbi:MAG: type IV secretory system conjugative DNA transfer family protein, partial [Candidatus Pacebacteria bacterium]|nr:type IV secretory system conjugative DNA transfer family protein [Candidatus Paceibacterota bacterium]